MTMSSDCKCPITLEDRKSSLKFSACFTESCEGIYDVHDPTDPTGPKVVRECPLDGVNVCPFWTERVEYLLEQLRFPSHNRRPCPDDVPADIAELLDLFISDLRANLNAGINIVLSGPVGSGKTCVAGLIAWETMRSGKRYLSRMINEYVDVIFTTAPDLFRADRHRWRRFGEVPLLIVDDLGTESASQAEVSEWNELLINRYDERRSTMITTNITDIDSLFTDERVRSRFLSCAHVWKTERGDVRLGNREARLAREA